MTLSLGLGVAGLVLMTAIRLKPESKSDAASVTSVTDTPSVTRYAAHPSVTGVTNPYRFVTPLRGLGSLLYHGEIIRGPSMGFALKTRVRTGLAAGGGWIRTCMGLFLSSGCFGLC
jgi:hypothetical protein